MIVFGRVLTEPEQNLRFGLNLDIALREFSAMGLSVYWAGSDE